MTVITEWYCGQTILVLGGTGFMGKVLLEKLLRSCPGFKKIYMLVRPKRDLSPSARIEEMVKLPLFGMVMKENPDVLKKITAIEGDVTMPNLGLSTDQINKLISEVTIVFNMAASVRMDSGLKTAIVNNLVSTKNVLDLCVKMKQIKAFLHLSTAFCYCDHDILEEKVYPPPHNPNDIIRAMEWMDDKTIELITPRLLGPHPNSYTYSKRLAEYLVYEYRDKLPVCIGRPSIVIPTYKEPMPGWTDTLNGPVGMMVGVGKGVIRSIMCDPDSIAEVMPVDVAINALITITWIVGSEKSKEVPVYNITSGDIKRLKWSEVFDISSKKVHENPFEQMIWYPNGDIRTNCLVHYLYVTLFHYLPAYFIDFLLFLARQKRFMVRLQNRISLGADLLQYFRMRHWNFRNENIINISKVLSQEDRDIFYIANVDYDTEQYLLNCMLGARVYLMKEPLSSLPSARRRLFIMYCLHCITRISFYGFLVWFLVKNVDSAKTFLDYSANLLQRIPVIRNFISIQAGND